MACAWQVEAFGPRPVLPRALAGDVDPDTWRSVAALATSGLSAPITTSAGRLFDAVAALCGLCPRVNYEGQAAIELEAACDPAESGRYEIPVDANLVLDPRPAIRAVVADVEAGTSVGAIAARFHHGLAEATAGACTLAARGHGLDRVVLSGGVFQNRVLLERTAELLQRAGLHVLLPITLPPGDGAIAYGQAAVAAARSPNVPDHRHSA